MLYIEIPGPKNLESIAREIRNPWTAVLSLFGLLSSVYRDYPHWRSNKLYSGSVWRTQCLPDFLVMVIQFIININWKKFSEVILFE